MTTWSYIRDRKDIWRYFLCVLTSEHWHRNAIAKRPWHFLNVNQTQSVLFVGRSWSTHKYISRSVSDTFLSSKARIKRMQHAIDANARKPANSQKKNKSTNIHTPTYFVHSNAFMSKRSGSIHHSIVSKILAIWNYGDSLRCNKLLYFNRCTTRSVLCLWNSRCLHLYMSLIHKKQQLNQFILLIIAFSPIWLYKNAWTCVGIQYSKWILAISDTVRYFFHKQTSNLLAIRNISIEFCEIIIG